MNVSFRNKKLSKELNQERKLVAIHGLRRAELIKRRLAQLEAAPNLAFLRKLPGGFHPLSGDRKNQYAMSLDQPYRLVFKPDPIALKADGGVDESSVTGVLVLEIVNYHE